MQIYSVNPYYTNYKSNNNDLLKSMKNQYNLNTLNQDTVSFCCGRGAYKPFTLLGIQDRLPKKFFPEKIWNAMNEAIRVGQNETPLAEIHKNVYSNLLNCKTLDEAKRKYPEFKDVVDLQNLDLTRSSTNSYLRKVKHGDFNNIGINQKNFSLLVLKKIYGELSTKRKLSQSFNTDIIRPLEKLNIHFLQKKYVDFLYRTKESFVGTRQKMSQCVQERWKNGKAHAVPYILRQLSNEEVERRRKVATLAQELCPKLGEALKEAAKDNPHVYRILGKLYSGKSLGHDERKILSAYRKGVWDNNPGLKKEFSKAIAIANKIYPSERR